MTGYFASILERIGGHTSTLGPRLSGRFESPAAHEPAPRAPSLEVQVETSPPMGPLVRESAEPRNSALGEPRGTLRAAEDLMPAPLSKGATPRLETAHATEGERRGERPFRSPRSTGDERGGAEPGDPAPSITRGTLLPPAQRDAESAPLTLKRPPAEPVIAPVRTDPSLGSRRAEAQRSVSPPPKPRGAPLEPLFPRVPGSRAESSATRAAALAGAPAPAPVIEVTIGRIEVRAGPPVHRAPSARAKAATVVTLDDYLRTRSGGGGR
jgi:hypothetical protein